MTVVKFHEYGGQEAKARRVFFLLMLFAALAAPCRQAIADEPPATEAPDEEAPDKEAPGEEAPDEEAPDEGVSGEDAPPKDKPSAYKPSPDEEEIIVHGYRVVSTEQTTGFAETIHVTGRARTMSSVPEVISEASGVQVRSLGGLGSYGAASIRGSTPNQVPVYLDGMQLNAGGSSMVDLGQISLDTLETIEIYRGGAPVSLGPSGIGGAIALKTRRFDQPASEVAYSQGSFTTMRALVLRGDRIGPADALFLVNTQYSRGDFVYLNTMGTPNTPTDDRFQPRQNNQHRSSGGLLKLSGELDGWQWKLSDNLHDKWQGLPGIESDVTETASLSTLRNNSQLGLGGPIAPWADLQLDGGYMFMRDDFYDANDEIGVGQKQVRSLAHAASAGALLETTFSPQHLSRLRIDGNFESYSCRDDMWDIHSQPRSRLRANAGAEHEWRPLQQLSVVPALRGELHHSRFGGGQASCVPLDIQQAATVDDFFLAPSLGSRLQVWEGLFLRANLGRYLRAPEITELFGDRGMVQGNTELEPEKGINADAGIGYELNRVSAISSLRLHAAWFGSRVDDLIVYVQNSQNTVRPENVDAAEITGLETGLRLSLIDLLQIEGNYTYLYTVNLSQVNEYRGNRLPGRPAHELYARFGVSKALQQWGWGGWIEMDYASENYLRKSNLTPALHRFLLGLGARLQRPDDGLTLTVQVKNLLDNITVRDRNGWLAPLRDFEGFPLPGRSIFTTLHWRS